MHIHAALVDRLTAALGSPARTEGHKRSWRVDVGTTIVNVVLDLPHEPLKTRVWVFDPRGRNGDAVTQLEVESPTEVDAVIAKVLERLLP